MEIRTIINKKLFRISWEVSLLLVIQHSIFRGEVYPKEEPNMIGIDLVVEREYNSAMNLNKDGTKIKTRNEVAENIEFVGEARTILKAHRFFEYRNLVDANEVSVFAVSYKDTVKLIDHRTDSMVAIVVTSPIYWPLIWANQVMEEESELKLSANESLELLLSFIEISHKLDTDRTFILHHWSDITREAPEYLRFVDNDSMTLETSLWHKSSREIVNAIPRTIKEEVTGPTVRVSRETYVIAMYMMDMDGAVHHLVVNVIDNRFILQSHRNLGLFGVPISID